MYGGGVKPTAKYYDEFAIKKRDDQVNLNKIERNYITITGNKKNCIRNCWDISSVPARYCNTIIWWSKCRKRYRKGKDTDDNGSGIALLFFVPTYC